MLSVWDALIVARSLLFRAVAVSRGGPRVTVVLGVGGAFGRFEVVGRIGSILLRG